MTQEFTADYSKWIEYLDQLGYRKVVTCKECKHFLKARNEDEYDSCSILFEMQDVPLKTDEDKYCAWAERRTSCDE